MALDTEAPETNWNRMHAQALDTRAAGTVTTIRKLSAKPTANPKQPM